METCYRHPGRETGVSCQNCGRPICPDCMTTSAVGMRCPECSKDRTKVISGRNLHAEPRVTYAIIGICVVALLATGSFGLGGGGNQLFADGAVFGPGIAEGEYWRLVTGAFLHAGLLHIAFNMYLLFQLGTMLEGTWGSPRFAAVYGVALLGGTLGALLGSLGYTVGASGAVFGLMGAALVRERARGLSLRGSPILVLLGLNLLLGFVIPNVSVGGHIGGLLFGVAVAGAWELADRRRAPWIGWSLSAALAVVAIGGAIAVATTGTEALLLPG